MWNEICEYVPTDVPHQVTAEWMVKRLLKKVVMTPSPTIVDLGCGAGNSVDFFRNLLPECTWIGIDIPDSPEVLTRKRTDETFMEFDGTNIPLPAESVNLVFCKQVLEHVRHPEALLKDVTRILIAKKGFLVGSTSQLEPYHSYQYWNFTPYGFKTIVSEAGIPLREILPGIDGKTLVQRTYNGRPKSFNKYFSSESPLNQEINQWAQDTNRSNRQKTVTKLEVCGQFCFICSKS